jgi:hypothetical protein
MFSLIFLDNNELMKYSVIENNSNLNTLTELPSKNVEFGFSLVYFAEKEDKHDDSDAKDNSWTFVESFW